MDPSQNYNFHSNYNFSNHPQNPNMQPQNPNTQRPEYSQNTGMNPQFQMPFMMPPNFGMQYPYNRPYMPYGYQPAPPNTFFSSQMDCPNNEPTNEANIRRFSSGSSDIPLFSTQISLGDVGGDTPYSFLAPTKQSSKKSSYMNWSTEDNKILLTGYFHYSTDSELGVNQKGDTFWGKISEYVNENSDSCKERTPVKCQSHFSQINKQICIFVGCYSQATRQVCSGWSDENYIKKGMDLYDKQEGHPFKFIEEWKMVRHYPKYMTGANESGSSGSKRKSDSDDVTSLVRPKGRDVTKKKTRASSGKSPSSRKAEEQNLAKELSNLATVREDF